MVGLGEGSGTAVFGHPLKAGATMGCVEGEVSVSVSCLFPEFYEAFWWAVAVVVQVLAP